MNEKEMDKKQEEIIEKAREKLVEKLMDAMGRYDAERTAGIFFSEHIVSIEGKSVAEWIINELAK
jgi:hypothetical protein